MRTFFFLLFFLFYHTLHGQKVGIIDSIYREGDLVEILGGMDEDKILQLERMTALEFHNIVNLYRTEQGKKAIYWDDKLWLAARNHNVYLMSHSNTLTHSELNKFVFFTGRDPEDRVNYVTYYSKDYELTGFENCAVSGELNPGPIDFNYANGMKWTEMLEMARSEAKEMFILWRNSSGHNQNMLDSEHLAHGTSIVYNQESGTTYATSVFTQKQKYYTPDTLNLDFHPGWESDFQITFKGRYQDYQVYPRGMNRTTFKYFSSFASQMEKKQIERDEKLFKLLKDSPEAETDAQLKRRFLKRTFYTGIFKLIKFELRQQYFNFCYTEEEFYALKGIVDIKRHLLNNPSLLAAKYWAGDLKLESDKQDKLCVVLKTYTFVPKK